MHANAINERPRALIGMSVQSHPKKIPIRRIRRDRVDRLLFAALTGYKGKCAVARRKRLETQNDHITRGVVAPLRTGAGVIAPDVTIVAATREQIRTVR